MRIDMDNTFSLDLGLFRGHVVERNLLFGKALPVCEISFEGPTKHVAIMSFVPDQSTNRLQVEGSFRAVRPGGIARPVSTAAAISAAALDRVAEARSPVAPQTPLLG
jgi:hypothetical protein